jgi:hypothetical protein
MTGSSEGEATRHLVLRIVLGVMCMAVVFATALVPAQGRGAPTRPAAPQIQGVYSYNSEHYSVMLEILSGGVVNYSTGGELQCPDLGGYLLADFVQGVGTWKGHSFTGEAPGSFLSSISGTFGATSASGSFSISTEDPQGATCSVTQAFTAVCHNVCPPSACPLSNIQAGPGYAGLKDAMKQALTRLYGLIEAAQGCYKFKSGYRSQQEQDKLRKKWHEIADRKATGPPPSPQEICEALKAAHFAQMPEGMKLPTNNANCKDVTGTPVYDSAGKAKGGPASKSRHTDRGAADVEVYFPHGKGYAPDLAQYGAAAKSAGLCPPPPSDKVHVYLKYDQNGVLGCWFKN